MRKPFIFLTIICVLYSCITSNNSAKVIKPASNNNFIASYSAKLGIQLNGSENKLLITTIADWMGTPYLFGGCTKEGTDCSCLVKTIYSIVYNKNLARSANDMFLNDINIIKKEQIREGDLVFFKIDSSKPSHVGIYIKNNKFVHATTSKGVIINSLDEAYYTKCFIDAGRVK
ncbi:MAG: C40 family peptidase [Bacteroidota bacterium]